MGSLGGGILGLRWLRCGWLSSGIAGEFDIEPTVRTSFLG